MLRAVKENREYNITNDVEKEAYKARGFDIVDEKGNIKEHAIGKKVPLEDFESLKAERDKLAAENKELKKEIKTLKKTDGDKETDPGKGE